VDELLDHALKPGTVTVGGPAAGVEVDVADVDRLGVRVHSVRVRCEGRGLAAAAEHLPEALSGALRRPFAVVEHDVVLGGTVARSPVEARGFFELRSSGCEATLERWRVTGEGRVRTPWTMTREDLGAVVRAMGAGGPEGAPGAGAAMLPPARVSATGTDRP
jgi:hypothetical protein